MSDVTRVEAIYLAAIGYADPGEQAAYLESACGADAELRRKVDELLAAHSKLGRFLEPPADLTHNYNPGTAPDPVTVTPGRLIAARYKLLERIGEGGMGEVWVAEQTSPVKRKVAIKLIKVGMDSKAVLARFEAERQALAVMDHPNIAKVLDGGLHDGKPYFVMELVKGVPITDFCDARKLTPKERLELFLPVCQAIQHAHMKGIIHRDIKPSNVLVALYDDRPIPKVIDFGIAKAAGPTLTDLTLHTGYGTVVGTPEYMSPEQASFNNLDIDTRSDVYSLGVLLYELLTGTTPVDRKSLKEAALLEVLRIVREVEAPRPSQKLSTNATLASIAANRGMEPTKLPKLMRGELDWIVLKALEKDRGRRYESANSLAADVLRHLTGEAVVACPPTLGYRLRKAYRRNRAAFWVATTFAVLSIVAGSIIFSTYKLALSASKQALQQAQLAEAKRIEAEQSNKAYLHTMQAYLETTREAEIRSNSARLDADLLEYKSDARVGLLRLARPLKDSFGPIREITPRGEGYYKESIKNHPEFVKLREFQSAAVIAAGQEFVPLMPPLGAADDNVTSPDGRLLLTGLERTGIELVAIPNLKRISVLREGSERLVKWGFSPDSKTCWTQDTDSIVRFWNTDGTFRAKTPLRPERFVYQAGMTIEEVRKVADKKNLVVMTDGVALIRIETVQYQTGQYDLYSTRTGQFIRRLNQLGHELSHRLNLELTEKCLSPDNRWILYPEIRQLVILSADDGRELARLDLAKSKNSPKDSRHFIVSPNRQWVLAWQGHQLIDPTTVQLWRSHDWKPVQVSAFTDAIAAVKGQSSSSLSFVKDNLLSLWAISGGGDAWVEGLIRIGDPSSWIPRTAFPHQVPSGFAPEVELGGTLFREDRTLYTVDPIQLLNPPRGRKYHLDLAKIAPDGRFFENLDTVTEKEIPYFHKGTSLEKYPYFHKAFFPAFGQVGMRDYWHDGTAPRFMDDSELRILPDPKRLNVPPEMLELWAQLVVGGELGPDGRFVPWDEPKWAAKQKELAAIKPPYADFPFPGWAATEPNLWYRIQANRTTGKERDKYRDEWQRRSGRVRPKHKPDTWRTPDHTKSAEKR